MPHLLREYVNSRGAGVRVDPEAGVIRGVKILGLESRNGRVYESAALERAVPLYEGAKVNMNHAGGDDAARDYRDRIGSIRGVVFREGEGLFGDLHYNPKHALAEQLAWDAANAPENVGFSHHVEAELAREGDRFHVREITAVKSVDLVADPATTKGLFESKPAPACPSWDVVTTEDVRLFRPDIVREFLAEDAAERRALREKVERYEAAEALRRRERLIRRLLAEHGLDEPDLDPWRGRAAGAAFRQILLEAPTDADVSSLVARRAALLHGAARSQEQQRVEGRGRADVEAFVRAIT